MATDRKSTKGRILQSAYDLFYREGFARVSVDAIAEHARVTKRTVYYHFQSKDDVAATALEWQHEYLVRQFQRWLEPEATGAAAMVAALFRELENWASGGQWLGSGFSRIAAELADMPGHPARRAARTHKAEIEKWLAERFADIGVMRPPECARQVMLLIEGGMSLALIHGDTRYIEAAGSAAVHLVSIHEASRQDSAR